MTAVPPLPHVVGALGGGRMGAGIAHAFLIKGATVIVVERDAEAAAGAQGRVAEAVAKSAERGTLPESPEQALSRFSTSTDYDSFVHCGLVVEAVPEDFELKVNALKAVEEHLPGESVLASNTSSLSVTDLAAELARPANFVGLHFFNPVPASTLIEVVLAKQTSPELADAVQRWVDALGKTAVVVNDAPGF